MIRALKLQNIRSYDNGLFEFDGGVNIIVGPNASGKTNLLEAIYMSAQGIGFRNGDIDMVAHDKQWARIDVTTDTETRVVKIEKDPLRKAFEIEGVEKRRLVDQHRIPVVLFEPNHMLLLGGEPERRRAYLDGILSQVEPGAKKLIADYRRALAQRNKLLKQENITSEHMFAWDVRISELAGLLVEARMKYVEFVDRALTDQYRAVSGNKEEVHVSYSSKLDVSAYPQALLHKLKVDFELDRLRGFSGAGPHRDDIQVEIDGVEARLSASRGESRSIILALKMSELAIVRERSEVMPLLLLDDVFSELDGKRRRLLAESLTGTQSWITTTDADAIVKNFMAGYNVIATT
jgi:DNA replication and repair protein RecF